MASGATAMAGWSYEKMDEPWMNVHEKLSMASKIGLLTLLSLFFFVMDVLLSLYISVLV